MAQPPVDRAREAAAEQVEKARLTFRRLSGLDRSGPPPPATLPGAPWHVWTLPNGSASSAWRSCRCSSSSALSSETGTDPLPAILFAAIAWADYADGIAARSPASTAASARCSTPSSTACSSSAAAPSAGTTSCCRAGRSPSCSARELFMLTAGRYAMQRGVELRINWWGRLAVTPVMARAVRRRSCGWTTLGAGLIYLGLFMSIVATIDTPAPAARGAARRAPPRAARSPIAPAIRHHPQPQLECDRSAGMLARWTPSPTSAPSPTRSSRTSSSSSRRRRSTSRTSGGSCTARSTSCAPSSSTACARSTRAARRSSPATTSRSSPTSSPAARPATAQEADE